MYVYPPHFFQRPGALNAVFSAPGRWTSNPHNEPNFYPFLKINTEYESIFDGESAYIFYSLENLRKANKIFIFLKNFR